MPKTGKPVSLVRRRRRGVADRRPAANFGHHARDAKLAAGRLPGPRHRRQPGSRSRAAARSGRLRAGIQRAHRQARVDVLGDSAVGEGSRRRDVGERVVADERARQRLGADGARCGSRPALSADVDAEQRLLRRRAARREPVCRVAGLSRCGHRQDEVAFPDGAPRALGLRQPGAARTWSRSRSTAGGSTPWRRSPSRASRTCSIA